MEAVKTVLEQKIVAITSYIPHTRVHALKTLPRSWVKRDDELGFGISGSKWRKYTSLIPHLKKYREVVVIGGAYSNHVLGISQLLIENRIKPTLFLLGNPHTKRQGNFLLTSLLVPESDIHWIPRAEWSQVQARANCYAQRKNFPTVVLPEGGCVDAALPGALTLAIDILRNGSFDHLFIDAGTGLSAIAIILAFAWMKAETLVHVLLLADEEQQFLDKLKQFHRSFEQFVEDVVPWPDRFRLYRPAIARSFGSVNAEVLAHIQFLAREEGVFTDPIYSTKLFLEAKRRIAELSGNNLIIHSGGALTLMGFQNKLARLKTTD